MTDTTASSASSEHQGNPLLYNAEEALDQPGDEWAAVTFPGQMPLDHTVELAEIYGLSSQTATDGLAEATPPTEPAPEDLVQLIQDLNQCNDALLLRVTELEEALERSQVALQAEIERTQALPGSLPVGAAPGPVQQQIAQLLSELDIANDGLRRTTIHNETLQAELESNQQRVAQLERECTLLQQRFGEKNTALHQAEETCRDLKARLHRQQRYTLQFKAALEKCLNMTPAAPAAPSSTAVQGQLLSPSALDEVSQPVAMPRSQQIQPWSAGQGSVTDNPSLSYLLRGLRSAGPSPVPAPAAAQPELLPPEPIAAIAPEPLPTVSADPPPLANPKPAPAALDPWLETVDQPTTTTALEAASLFTEPSPWGEPVAAAPQPTPVPSPATAALPAEPVRTQPVTAPTPAPSQPAAPALPSYSYPVTAPKASPSPLVHPLRSQKKIGSIAAVELPSFGRAVRRRTV